VTSSAASRSVREEIESTMPSTLEADASVAERENDRALVRPRGRTFGEPNESIRLREGNRGRSHTRFGEAAAIVRRLRIWQECEEPVERRKRVELFADIKDCEVR
jgi:hypothetical protein